MILESFVLIMRMKSFHQAMPVDCKRGAAILHAEHFSVLLYHDCAHSLKKALFFKEVAVAAKRATVSCDAGVKHEMFANVLISSSTRFPLDSGVLRR